MATKQAPATHNEIDSATAPSISRARLYLNQATGRYEFWGTSDATQSEAFLANGSPCTMDTTVDTRRFVVDSNGRVRI